MLQIKMPKFSDFTVYTFSSTTFISSPFILPLSGLLSLTRDLFRMASVQRMIKSGIRLYKQRGIDFAASSINRLGASPNSFHSSAEPNSYHPFCSSWSSDGGRWILLNGKRQYFVDTFSMINALEAKGIPPKHAKAITYSLIQVLVELEKDPHQPPTSLHAKLKSLRKTIDKMRPESTKDVARVRHSPVNTIRRIPGKLPNLSAETINLNEIAPDTAERFREELARVKRLFKLDMGILLPNIVGGLFLTLDPTNPAIAKTPT